MKKFKLLKSLLALFLVTALSGCSKSDEDSDVVTIDYWHVNSQSFGGPAVSALVEQFNASQNEIKVVEKFIPDNYLGIMQEMQTGAISGDIPELVQIGWSYLEYFAGNFDYVTPEDLIENHGENKNFMAETFEPAVSDLAIATNGDRIGFSYGLSNLAVYVNTSLLGQIGKTIEDVQTWEDIQSVANEYTSKTGKYGICISEWNSIWEVQQLLESNGAKIITDGEVTINSPEAIEAYSLYADMVLETKSALHVTSSEGEQAFINGETAMFVSPISDNVTFTKALGDDVVKTVAAPNWQGKETVAPVGGNFLAVTTKDEAKQAATLEFVEFLLSKESMVAWTSEVGYIPHVLGVEDSQMHPNVLEATTVLEYSVPWYCFPGNEGLNAEVILTSYRDKILGGNISVEEALKAMEKEIKALYE